MFQMCQIGNFSIHIALRNLRPPGTPTSRTSAFLISIYNCNHYSWNWLTKKNSLFHNYFIFQGES